MSTMCALSIYINTHINQTLDFYVITIPLNYTNRLPIASNTKGENSAPHQ